MTEAWPRAAATLAVLALLILSATFSPLDANLSNAREKPGSPALAGAAQPAAQHLGAGLPDSTGGGDAGVSASTAEPKLVQTQDYDYRTLTHEITTALSYIYVTPAGNYSFSMQLPWDMSYTSLWGNTTSFSGYGIRESLGFLIPSASTTTVAQTSFAVNTTQVSGAAVHGNLYCSYDFSKTPETTSCKYHEATNVSAPFNLVWITTGDYLGVNRSTTLRATTQTGLTFLGNLSAVRLGATSTPSDWRSSLSVDWSDYGTAEAYYGRLSFASAIYYGVEVQFPKNVANVDPSVVQTKTCAGDYSIACGFSSGISSNDMLITVFLWRSGSSETVTDSMSNTWTQQITSGDFGIWTAVASSSGSDTVTCANSGIIALICITYEVSGARTSALTTSSGSGTSSSPAVSSFSPSTNGFVVGGYEYGDCVGSPFPTYPTSSTSGFTFIPGGNSGGSTADEVDLACQGVTSEYAPSWGGGSTTLSISTRDSVTYVYVAIGLSAGVTQPIQCTMANGASPVTLTLSGGSPLPSTVACDGSTHDVTVNPSVTLTATEPSDGSTQRQRFSGGSSTTSTTTCSSGTCSTTWSFTNYDQYKQSVAYSITCASGATCSAPTLTYYQSGSSTYSTLSTTAASYWIDQGGITSASNSTIDSLNNKYTPYFSSWLISGTNVIDTPIVYSEGL